MYISTVSRSLGDPGAAAAANRSPVERCAQRWKLYRSKNPQITFDGFIAKHPSCRGKIQCGSNTLPSGGVLQVDCTSPAPQGLGSVVWAPGGSTCGDAPTGMLIDCWNAAVKNGLGAYQPTQLTQVQLDALATAYQRFQRPNYLAGRGMGGWQFNGKKMVWVNNPHALGRFGQSSTVINEIPNTDIITPPTPDQAGLPQMAAPSWLTTLSPGETQSMIPTVSTATLLQAAAMPNAPVAVQQAGAQLAAQQAASGSSWFTSQSMISGLPNYAIVGAAAVIVLMLMSRRR